MTGGFDTVAVIGLGLIGGSVALASRQRGHRVVGFNRSGRYRDQIEAAGIEVAETIGDAVAAADLVVLAVPLPMMGQVGAEVARAIKPTATVIDIGSVKAPVRAALTEAGLGEHYVATHPMAGNEHSGFAAADADLLRGARWALTGARDPNRQQAVAEYLTKTFAANLTETTDTTHDEVQALISGLPHVLAVQLLNQTAQSPHRDLALSLAAGSFRDGTRVAHTDPERTKALVEANPDEVAKQLRAAATALTDLATALENRQDTAAFFHQADPLR
ncbi:MAG: prephenate dehydrogenase/arogenate dehydrogenase family protein [Cellulomonadaceae bacterium]|nr:prephenate dehydrogenase/arogenate dehydrogenase family protein [Cellulomonadaceae bacterium]